MHISQFCGFKFNYIISIIVDFKIDNTEVNVIDIDK